jgi:hypothetical protein
MSALSVTLFSFAWFLFFYSLFSLLCKRFVVVGVGALLYVTTLILIGVFGEVFTNTLLQVFFGQTLWEYHFLPIHGGYTSLYSIFLWGAYGFYLYLAHTFMQQQQYVLPNTVLAGIVAIEAIVFEIAVNGLFFLLFGSYIFYYFPGDLLHFSSFVAFPCYFLAGLVVLKTLRVFKTRPRFFIAMNLALVFVFIFS